VQFTSEWRKRKKDSAQLAELLKAIEPKRLAVLLGNNLDYDVMAVGLPSNGARATCRCAVPF